MSNVRYSFIFLEAGRRRYEYVRNHPLFYELPGTKPFMTLKQAAALKQVQKDMAEAGLYSKRSTGSSWSIRTMVQYYLDSEAGL